MGSMPDNPMHFKRKRWTLPPPLLLPLFLLLYIYGIKTSTRGGRGTERETYLFFSSTDASSLLENGRLSATSGDGEKAAERPAIVCPLPPPPLPSSLPSLIDNSGMSPELYDLIRAGGENLRRNYCTRLMEAARLIAAEREREILFPISRSLFQERKREEEKSLCSKRIVFH